MLTAKDAFSSGVSGPVAYIPNDFDNSMNRLYHFFGGEGDVYAGAANTDSTYYVPSASSAQEVSLEGVGDTLNSVLDSIDTPEAVANMIAQQNTKSAQAYNNEAMRLQYEYQRLLRKTAYQDTMLSMKEAGLNPILAYMNGAVSASAPSGAGVSAAETFERNSTKADEIVAIAKVIKDFASSTVSAFRSLLGR